MVRLAKNGLIDFRVCDPVFKISMVLSTSGAPFSPATKIALLICPDSIIEPARTNPFKNPRHAFEISRIWVFPLNPISRCTYEAVAGSSLSLQTAQCIRRSTFRPSIPVARSLFPASDDACDGL